MLGFRLVLVFVQPFDGIALLAMASLGASMAKFEGLTPAQSNKSKEQM